MRGLSPGLGLQPAGVPALGGGASDPDFSSVVVLAGFDRAGDANKASYVEEGPLGLTFSNSSSGASGTYEAGGKFGGGLRFAVNNHVWTTPDNAALELGSDPFTIEGWYKFDNTSGANILCGRWGGGQNSWYFYFTGTQLTLVISTTGSNLIEVAKNPWAPANSSTFHHIATDYDGTAYRTYVDGVMIGKSIASYTIFDGTSPLYLGFPGGGIVGYQDEVRITKGVARYASDGGFTAPTEKFPRT